MELQCLWIKYIINIVVYFVGYVYIMDLINAQKIEHIKKKILYVASDGLTMQVLQALLEDYAK
jgi:hypothetical protein